MKTHIESEMMWTMLETVQKIENRRKMEKSDNDMKEGQRWQQKNIHIKRDKMKTV